VKRIGANLVFATVVNDETFWDRPEAEFVDKAMDVDRTLGDYWARPLDSITSASASSCPLKASMRFVYN
jgi:hypothetical protein